ncbi:MAG: hypothetical protein J0I19_17110, partial [Alphaproteobacteria bacterium]|nr:hypothetical protein [Alphaproteobacteria bacterium]
KIIGSARAKCTNGVGQEGLREESFFGSSGAHKRVRKTEALRQTETQEPRKVTIRYLGVCYKPGTID